jgi:ABC-type multidrug transport system, ATPase and permease components
MKKYFVKDKILGLNVVLLTLLNSVGSVGIAYILQKIVDSAVNKDLLSFKRILGISIGYFLMFGVINYIYKLLSSMMVTRVIKDIRTDVFTFTIDSEYEELSERNMGNIMSILSNDTKVIEDDYIKSIFIVIENIITFVITLIAFVYISPLVTICLIAGVGLLGTIPNFVGKLLEKKQSIFSEKNAQFIRSVKDYLDGIEVIKSFSKEYIFKKEFEHSNLELGKGKLSVDRIQAIGDSLSFMFGFLLMVIVIMVSAYQVLMGVFSLGTLIALVQLSNTFVNPIIQLLGNIAKIKGCHPIIKKIEENRNINDEKDGKQKNKKKIQNLITLKKISYEVDNRIIIENIDLDIEKGKKYLLIGKSGSGKSTLLKILAGLIKNYQGEIICDERNISIESSNYYENVSIVNQNVYVFDKSIKENILLGEVEEKEKLQKAIEDSCLQELINKSRNRGVGENGRLLSGGERQRIAIARALYHRKEVLLLDEITSSLDRETAKKIERKLISNKNLTVISVCHRVEQDNINLYHKVMEMNDGQMSIITER